MKRVLNILKNYLKEFVYGGIDGSITSFAIVAGAAGANLSSALVVVLGVANLLADGFSMSVSAYLASKTDASNKKSSIKIGLVTYASFIVMGAIPLIIYISDFFKKIDADLFTISFILTSVSFIFIGWLKAYVQQKNLLKAILETLLLGVIASGIAFYTGRFLKEFIS